MPTIIGDGGQTILGDVGNDFIIGGLGNDSVVAGFGNDLLFGDAGDDTLAGEGGDDAVLGGGGNDALAGDAGNDFMLAGAGNDTLLGGDGNDGVYGEDGDDSLRGGAGHDAILGGEGHDALAGDGGDDFMLAGNGNDTLLGGDGHDGVYGEAGDDSLTGGEGNDAILGADGNDVLAGDAGEDFMLGDTGNDTLLGGDGNDGLYGEAGDDSLAGGEGNDGILAGEGNDVLAGDAGDDFMLAGIGNDTVFGGTGNDGLYGETGDDDLAGDAGDDYILAGSGNDTLSGDEGNDGVYGEAGDDSLSGGTGNDAILGDEGNDALAGEAGDDYMLAGTGDDTLLGGDGNDGVYGEAGVDSLSGGSGNDAILGGEGNDALAGDAGDDYMDGGSGNDSIDGGIGNDGVYGEAGDDSLSGGGGNDALLGGEGNDALTGDADDDYMLGGSGHDSVDGGTGNDGVYGEAGDDSLSGGVGNDAILGGEGHDTLAGDGGDDYMLGGSGNDSVDGGSGNDLAIGDDGDDTLSGGAGFNQLIGGEGNDLFIAHTGGGADTIVDFRQGQDRISLVEFGFSDFAALMARATVGADGVLLQLTDTQQLLVAGATLGSFAAADVDLGSTTLPPPAPVLDLIAADDTGASSTDNLTNKASVTVTVAAQAGTRVTLGAQTAAALAGVASFTVALAEGLNSLSATATDGAGNTSAAGTLTITRDSAPPAAPSLALAAASDTGTLGDGITSDTTPTLTGTAEAGAQITILEAGLALGTTQADATTGAWRFTTAALADGEHVFTATATDAAGNTGVAAAPLALTIAAATAPSLTFALSASDEASAAGDNTTATGIVTLVGVATPGAAIALDTGHTTLSDARGGFRLVDVSLLPGTQTVTLTVTDPSGQTASQTLDISRVDGGAPNSVVTWIREALQAIADETALPTYASRALAMESLAVYNVINAIDGTPGYLFNATPPAGASADAAIARAAHDVLVALFPGQKADLDAALAAALASVPDGQAEDDGVALGASVAARVIAIRQDDGWNTVIDNVGRNAPGQWQPTPGAYASAVDPQWANLTPFTMQAPNQFLPAAPPALDSQAFLDAFNQVKDLGSATSTIRTAEETGIARFWAAGSGTYTPSGMWNEVATQLTDAQDLGLSSSARLFAQLNLALADSGIAAWNTKYTYDFWRPVTAIQDAANLADPRFVADRDWSPLLPTPAFPAYTSGHSTYSAAAATVLTDIFGDATAFSLTSLSAPGLTRSYASFWEAANEAGYSRILGGIHYSFDNTAGLATGTSIGQWVLKQFDTAADTAAPTIRLQEATGFVTGAIPTLHGTVLDNLSGVVKLVFSLNSGAVQSLDFGPDGAFALPLASLLAAAPDGRQSLDFFALDAAGNQGSLSSFTFTLARANPALVLDAAGVRDGGIITADQALIGAVNLVEGNSLKSLTYAFDGGAKVNLGFGDGNAFDQSLDLRTLAAGAHTLTIEAVDAVGHVAIQTLAVTVPTLPFTITRLTPDADAMMVGVTYRPKIDFSRPVDPATLTAESFYATDADGAVLPATILPLGDKLGAWLLFNQPLPGGASITLHVDGSKIRALDGSYLDAAGTGAPGGSVLTEMFATVSRQSVPGTTITGIVVDPGPDREMMTPDDVRAGPNGLNDYANNIFKLPLEHVKVYVLGQEDRAVFTDAEGRFMLTDVPVGNVKVAVDGRTATNAPAGSFFPEMVMDTTIRPGTVNTLMGSMGPIDAQKAHVADPAVYLPRLDSSMFTPLSDTAPTVAHAPSATNSALTADQLAQLSLTVAPGSLVDAEGNPVSGGQIGIGVVPPSMVMDMLPPGVLQHSFDITIQAPGGAVFTTPAVLTLPNVFGLAPGEKAYVMSFDHTTGRLVINGTATVSADGQTVTTDPGAGIVAPGWHGIAPQGSDGDGDIYQRCGLGSQPRPGTDPMTLRDYTDAGADVANIYGYGDMLAKTAGREGLLTGRAGKVAGAVNAFNTVSADYDKVGDRLTQMYTASLTGDTGGYGPPDGFYYAAMAFGVAGDSCRTIVDGVGGVLGLVPDKVIKSVPGAAQLKTTVELSQAGLAAADQLAQLSAPDAAYDPIGNIKKLRTKLEDQGPAQATPTWKPPVKPELPEKLKQLDKLIDDYEAAKAKRHEDILDYIDKVKDVIDKVTKAVDPDKPPPADPDVPDLLDKLSKVKDAVKAATDALKKVLDNGPVLDDLEKIGKAAQDAVDAEARDNGAPLGPMDSDAKVVEIRIETVEYGPVFYGELINLDTGDELRFQFDPRDGVRPFLEPLTHYKLTVYDPVSREVASVTFTSEASGVRTTIPPLFMRPDDGSVGPGGFSTLAAEVLGINPAIADNFVRGITDSAAIASGADAAPALANVIGQIGAVDLLGEARAVIIEASGSNAGQQSAYIATGSHGLAIVNVTNPRSPVLQAQLDLAGNAASIAFDSASGLIAVALGTGIAIVDVSQPTTPRLLYTINAEVQQVEIVNGRLYYVAAGVVTEYDMLARQAASGAILASSAVATGLASDAGHLYVMQGLANTGSPFSVIDISGDAPVVTGTATLPARGAPDGSGRPLSRSNDIIVADGIAYVPTASGTDPIFRIGGYATINVSNPAAPVLISDADSASLVSGGFGLTGAGRAIGVDRVTIGNTTVSLLDVIRTIDPGDTASLANRITLPGNATPLDVAVSGGNAFVGTNDGLQIVQFQALDRLGVAPSVTVTGGVVDADTTRPGIQVQEGSAIDLGIRVTDDIGVRSVELLVDGRSVLTDLSVPWNLSTQLPILAARPSSNVTLQIRATDTGGNIGLSAPITVELVPDPTPFVITGVTPVVGGIVSTLTTKLTYDFSRALDPNSVEAADFTLRLTDGTLISATGIALRNDGTRVEVSYSPLAAGSYLGDIRATSLTDLAGNALDTVDRPGQLSFDVQAFSNVWTGGFTGFWQSAANWSRGVLPDATDNVLVSLPAGGTVVNNATQSGFSPNTAFGGTLTYAGLAVGGGTLRYDSNAFREIRTGALINAGTIDLGPHGTLTMSGSQLHNEGVITVGATLLPLAGSGFQPGGAGRLVFTEVDGRIDGGGVIELSPGSNRLNTNPMPSLSATNTGSTVSPTNPNLSFSIPSQIENVDNTIRGGGSISGNMTLINGAQGIIQATTGNLLEIAAIRTAFLSQGAFSQFFSIPGTIVNQGVIEARSETEAGSTLLIRGAEVQNAGGVLRAEGQNTTLMLSTATVDGGRIEAIGAEARILTVLANASAGGENILSGGVILDSRQGAATQFVGKTVLTNTGIYGEAVAGNALGVAQPLVFNGHIDNHGRLSVYDVNLGDVIELRSTTRLTGGGAIEIIDGLAGRILLRGAEAQYTSDTDPAITPPSAPAPVYINNIDNIVRMSGTITGALSYRDYDVFSQIQGDYLTFTLPEFLPIGFINESGGVIESFLNYGDTTGPLILEWFEKAGDAFQFQNAGIIRTGNAVELTIRHATILNQLNDDAAPGAVLQGTIDAEFFDTKLTLGDTVILGGKLRANNPGSLLDIVDIAGSHDGVHLHGVAVRVESGSSLRINPGAAVVLDALETTEAPDLAAAVAPSLWLNGKVELLSSGGGAASLLIGPMPGGAPFVIDGDQGLAREIVLGSLDGSGARSLIGTVASSGVQTAEIIGDLTISGDGILGDAGMELSIVNGTITLAASNTGQLDMQAQKLIIYGSSTLRAAGGVVLVGGIVENDGLLESAEAAMRFTGEVFNSDSASISVNGGSMAFEDALHGGDVLINGDALISFAAAVEAGTRIVFDEQDGPGNGELLISDLVGFGGVIVNSNAGDQINLVGVDFDAAPNLSFDFDGFLNRLTVSDGSDTITLELDRGGEEIVAAQVELQRYGIGDTSLFFV